MTVRWLAKDSDEELSLRVVVRRVGGAPLAGVWTRRLEGLCTRKLGLRSALLAAVCDIPILLNIGSADQGR